MNALLLCQKKKTQNHLEVVWYFNVTRLNRVLMPVLQRACICLSVRVMVFVAMIEFCVLFIWKTSFFPASRLNHLL